MAFTMYDNDINNILSNCGPNDLLLMGYSSDLKTMEVGTIDNCIYILRQRGVIGT